MNYSKEDIEGALLNVSYKKFWHFVEIGDADKWKEIFLKKKTNRKKSLGKAVEKKVLKDVTDKERNVHLKADIKIFGLHIVLESEIDRVRTSHTEDNIKVFTEVKTIFPEDFESKKRCSDTVKSALKQIKFAILVAHLAGEINMHEDKILGEVVLSDGEKTRSQIVKIEHHELRDMMQNLENYAIHAMSEIRRMLDFDVIQG